MPCFPGFTPVWKVVHAVAVSGGMEERRIPFFPSLISLLMLGRDPSANRGFKTSHVAPSIPKIRLYISAQNILTITNYSGLDPEVGAHTIVQTGITDIGSQRVTGDGYPNNNFDNGIDKGTYPIPKSFIGGIQISF